MMDQQTLKGHLVVWIHNNPSIGNSKDAVSKFLSFAVESNIDFAEEIHISFIRKFLHDWYENHNKNVLY